MGGRSKRAVRVAGGAPSRGSSGGKGRPKVEKVNVAAGEPTAGALQ
jgi:hypothetical protein